MRCFTYVFILWLQLFSIGCFAQRPDVKVGVISLNLVDSSRSNWPGNGPRPMRSIVWYPAANGGQKEVVNDAQQFSSPVALYRGAQISDQKNKYPLVIISHGSQGNAQKMQWLGCYLASKGFIAVAISHNGTDEEELRKDGLTLSDFCMWERPRDVSAVIDSMFKDKFFSAKIDTARVVVAGFSLGGATAIWVAGAIFNMDRLAEKEGPIPERYVNDVNRLTAFVQNNPIGINSARHRADSFKDTRVKAVFALAPAIGQGFDKQGLQNITVPVQIVTGKEDKVNLMAFNAAHYTQNIKTARPLIVLPGERGHYTKPPVGDERGKELQEIAELAVKFFNEIIK